MAVYTRLTEEEVQALVTAYRLGRLLRCAEIAEGVENSNFLLEVAPEAAPPQRVILTLYEKRVALSDLPFFLGVMAHLADGGIPCPRPLTTADGETLTQARGKAAAMATFLEGRSVRAANLPQLRSLGAMLARMHLAAEGFTLTRENALALAGWRALYEKIATKLDGVQNGLRSMVEQELGFLAAQWPRGLPAGVIHADLFPDNVFFQGDVVSGVIDFYFACNDYFMYDLAIVMNAWCFEPTVEFNITKTAALLRAYHQIRPISEVELAALPILCRGAALRFLLTRAHDLIFHDAAALVRPKDPLEYLKKLAFHQQVQHHREYGL